MAHRMQFPAIALKEMPGLCSASTSVSRASKWIGPIAAARPHSLHATRLRGYCVHPRPPGDPCMHGSSPYTPPKIWSWNKDNGGRFANINRPIAGPTHDKDLPLAATRCSSIRWAPPTASRSR